MTLFLFIFIGKRYGLPQTNDDNICLKHIKNGKRYGMPQIIMLMGGCTEFLDSLICVAALWQVFFYFSILYKALYILYVYMCSVLFYMFLCFPYLYILAMSIYTYIYTFLASPSATTYVLCFSDRCLYMFIVVYIVLCVSIQFPIRILYMYLLFMSIYYSVFVYLFYF